MVKFDWTDPLNLTSQLKEEEIVIRYDTPTPRFILKSAG